MTAAMVGGKTNRQLKKGQGEQNQRLDRIASLLEEQNELLRQLLVRLGGTMQLEGPPPPHAG